MSSESANVFQLYSPQRVDPDRRLTHLSRMNFKRPLRCKTLLAALNFVHWLVVTGYSIQDSIQEYISRLMKLSAVACLTSLVLLHLMQSPAFMGRTVLPYPPCRNVSKYCVDKMSAIAKISLIFANINISAQRRPIRKW
jgi:hypothetical protein